MSPQAPHQARRGARPAGAETRGAEGPRGRPAASRPPGAARWRKSRRAYRQGSLDAACWRRLGWLAVAVQFIGCALLVLVHGWRGAPVLATFAAISAAGLYGSPPVPSFLSFVFALAAVANAGGWIWDLYDRYWWYDDVLHFLTPFAIVGALVATAFRLGWVEPPKRASRLVLGAAAMALLIGLGWEALEAIFIKLAVGDTLLDLAFDTAGGAISGWLVWKTARTGAR